MADSRFFLGAGAGRRVSDWGKAGQAETKANPGKPNKQMTTALRMLLIKEPGLSMERNQTENSTDVSVPKQRYCPCPPSGRMGRARINDHELGIDADPFSCYRGLKKRS